MDIRLGPSPENPYAWDFPDSSGRFPEEPYDELGWLSSLLAYNYFTTASVGGLLSLCLFYLVIFQTKGSLRDYQKMLLICAVTDFIYWAMDNLLWMKIESNDGVYMVKSEGLANRLSRPGRVVVNALYSYTTVLTNTILPVQMFFRYSSLTRSSPLSSWQTLLLVLLAVGLTSPVFVLACYSYGSSASVRPGFNYGTLWHREFPLPNLIFADARSWYQRAFFLYGGGLLTLAYGISLVIAYKTAKEMNAVNSTYSNKTKRLQNQLSTFLMFQTLIPLLVSVVPLLLIVVSGLLYTNMGLIPFFCAIVISWIPLLNPIMTITVIVPYRRTILKALGCGRKDSVSVVTGATPTSQEDK